MDLELDNKPTDNNASDKETSFTDFTNNQLTVNSEEEVNYSLYSNFIS